MEWVRTERGLNYFAAFFFPASSPAEGLLSFKAAPKISPSEAPDSVDPNSAIAALSSSISRCLIERVI